MEIYTLTWTNENLVTATPETLLQIVTGATRRARVLEWSINLDGIVSTAEPWDWWWERQTTAGSASAATPRQTDSGGPAAIMTAQKTFTAEPTAGVELLRGMIHPQGGSYTITYDPLRTPLKLAVSDKLGLKMNAPVGGVTCSGYAIVEE